MGKFLESLTSGIRDFLKFLFRHFYTILSDLWRARSDIQPRYLLSDFVAVLRSAGMFTFFNLVAVVVFTVLPQGKDILLIIAEDILHYKVGNLFCLLVGTVFWSVVSEYGTRYSIYVTDNSGNSLSDKRVLWRKAVQKTVADFFLMMPFLIVLLGFLINYLQDTSLTESEKRWGFGIPALCLYIVFSLVVKFYFSEKRKQWRANPNSLQKFMLLPDREREWCNKLLGIYNRYVFILRKPANFTNKVRGPYQVFCDNFLNASKEDRNKFPQNPLYIEEGTRVPAEFDFEEFTDNNDDSKDDLEGNYKWIYSVPFHFYQRLHAQLRVICLLSLVIFLAICFLPIKFYSMIGAPGLVVIAFGCWSGLYAGLLYMDFAVFRSFSVSLRFILFLGLIFSSCFNNDHPVRYNSAGYSGADTRPSLKEHFLRWFDQYQKDSMNSLYTLKSDTATRFYPLVFVCAEGGALRTGAFAAQTLSFLQDSISKHYNIDVKNSVYAYSGVSGGGLGISFFNAIAYLSKQGDLKQDTSYSTLTKAFFNEDYLSPVIGKMFYSDIVSLFVPVHIEKFDRAVVLEKAWEHGFEKVIKPDGRNIFSADFRSLYNDNNPSLPAFFINTTEAETGKQCWLTNVRPDASMSFAAKRDLMAYKIRGGINYSTMTNFSSRFPLFSPAAAVVQDEGKKFHYLDGGYVENTGTGTMLEVLQALQPVFDSLAWKDSSIEQQRKYGKVIKPFVFILQYNQYNDGPPDDISFANEFTEILYGIYNTRNGRATTALSQIQKYTKSLGGESFILPLQKTGSEVPMNWVLSNKSLKKIEDDIKQKWAQRDVGALRKFFAIDTVNNERWNDFKKRQALKVVPMPPGGSR
ncbi:MAG: patatin-like phospholipase family protein [Chitinophagaceae bacterium]|nr:patatin-like phospholipase family protein [Chitinophagaceae bacterium]